MIEYTAKILKDEFVYRFDEGLLTCSGYGHGVANTLSLDLNNTPVTVSEKKCWPYQFKMSLYGMCFITVLCGYWIFRDHRNGDTVGMIGSVFGWVVVAAVLGYFLFKNFKKYQYLMLKTEDKGGINIIYSQVEKEDEFKAFVQEVKAFLARK